MKTRVTVKNATEKAIKKMGSVAELSFNSHVSIQVIHNLRTGKTKHPQISTIAKIAKAAGMDINEFVS